MLRVSLPASAASSSPAPVTPFLTGFEHPMPVVVVPDGTLVVGDWGTGVVYRVAAA